MLVWNFELNMCKEEYCSENICIDEFGSAIFSVSNPDIDIDSDDWICFGADYNFCKENGIDSSAMYLYVINNKSENTFYDIYRHYEIDFENENWEENLKFEMYDFVFDCYMKGLV